MIRAIAPIVFAASLLASLPAVAQEGGALCADRFPASEWSAPAPAGPVIVSASGVDTGIIGRFVSLATEVGGVMVEEMGSGLDGVTLCVFADELPLDPADYDWPPQIRLRAVSFAADRILVISAWNLRHADMATIFGLAHQAQWGLLGDDYPEPFGSAVGHWYVSRHTNRLDSHHSIMRFAKVIRSLPEVFPFATASIPDVKVWNPETQESPIGDFVGFAVAEAGTGILADPDPAQLVRLEVAWQEALLAEARGSSSATTGWIAGAALIIGAVLAAVLLAWLGARRRRMLRPSRPARRTIPIAGDPAGVGAASEEEEEEAPVS